MAINARSSVILAQQLIALVIIYICVKYWGSPLSTFILCQVIRLTSRAILPALPLRVEFLKKTAILCNLLSFYVTIDIFEVIESEKILLNYKNIIPLDLEKKCCLNISQNLGTKLRVN